MSLLDNASLLLTPNAYKASKLYSVIPSNGNGDFTATRATTATRINSSGLVESVALNVPRVDYSLGGCPNILLEPQRTNLALQSSSFDSASWSKIQSSITANSTTSPSGVTDADTFTGNGTSGVHAVAQAVNVTNAVVYTFSAYIKKDTNNFVQFATPTSGFGTNVWANFDLNNGVVGSVGTAATSAITNVGNGWYRCTMTASASSTASATFDIVLINSATSTRYQTNTLTTSVFIWGAQLEAGAYATSFIPTTTASVTRNADSITRNNIFTNGLITAAGGTWFVELRGNRVYTRDNTGRIGVGDSNVLSNDAITITTGSTAGRLNIQKRIASVLTTLYVTTTDTCKIAIKWNGSTADVFENGVKVVSATSFTTTVMEFFGVNTSNPCVPFFINEMALFPTPLTDAQCIALTQ